MFALASMWAATTVAHMQQTNPIEEGTQFHRYALRLIASLEGADLRTAEATLLELQHILPADARSLREATGALLYVATSKEEGKFTLSDINTTMWSPEVNKVISSAKEMVDAGFAADPGLTLGELRLEVTRAELYKPATALVEAISRRAPLDELERIARKIVVKDRSQDEAEFKSLVRNAHEWEDHKEATSGAVSDMRICFGFPHLSLTQTGPRDKHPGFMSPGHLAGFVAPSGHGKSSFVRELVRTSALDLRNWGFPFAKVLTVIVEEEPDRVTEAAQIGRHAEYSDVGDQVLIAKVNSSRRRFGAAVLQSVVQAVQESHAAGLPVREFVPFVVLLDYLQEIAEQGENPHNEAIMNTTSLLRAISECNLDEIEKWSKVRWTDIAPKGMKWPEEELSDHRIAVLVTAQVKGLDEKTLRWKPGMPVDDFVLRDATTGEPLWEVRPGDYRIVRRGDVKGSTKFLDNLSTLGFLHRSNPNAARVYNPKTGRYVLEDTRARIIFEKQRYGSGAPLVEMAFSVSPDGSSGKWYDYRATRQVENELAGMPVERKWNWDWDRDTYRSFGGPILPVRPKRRPGDHLPYK